MKLLKLRITNFGAIASLEIAPNGNSFELTGPNGAGKSAAINAAWFALRGKLGAGRDAPDEAAMLRNGADKGAVELEIGDTVSLAGYRIKRTLSRAKSGGKLTVTDAAGRSYPSPAALLDGFVSALAFDPLAFSRMTGREQAAEIRRLDPSLDMSDLDERHAAAYAERTAAGRDRDRLRALADSAPRVEVPVVAEKEKSVGELLVTRAGELAKDAANAATRREAVRAREDAGTSQGRAVNLARAVEETRKALRRAEEEWQAEDLRARSLATKAHAAEEAADSLVDSDLAALDGEIAGVEDHNRGVRARLAAVEHAKATNAARDEKIADAERGDGEWKAADERVKAIEAERKARIADAKLPLPGLAITDDAVTFDDGARGPVPLALVNTGKRIEIGFALQAARKLPLELAAIPDASVLDAASRQRVYEVADRFGVQVVMEIVTDGGPLEAVIREADVEEL